MIRQPILWSILLCGMVVLFPSISVSTDVYIYRDKNGVLTFDNVPCTESQQQEGCRKVIAEKDREYTLEEEQRLRRIFQNQDVPIEQLIEQVRTDSVLYRRWTWTRDVNGDGRVTISDMPGWFKWIFFYPGDWLIYVMLKQKGRGTMAEFFELTAASYGGWGSLFVSFVVWWFFLIGIATLPGEISEDIEKRTIQFNKCRDWYRNKFKHS